MTEEYYQIGPSVNNIDFYVGGITISIYVSGELTVDPVPAYKIVSASASLSGFLLTNPSGIKIASASSSLSASLTKTVTTLELLNVLIHVHSNLNFEPTTSKIAYASSSLSGSLSSQAVMYKTTSASSHIHNNLNLTSQAYMIQFANNSPGFESSLNLTALGLEILLASSSISILSKFLINPPIRFSPDFIDTSSIRTFLILDGKPLTNHNRALDVSRSPVYIQNTNWNNRNTRYYKRASNSDRATFSISWSFLPNQREKTVDNRMARNYISSIAEDPDVHELKIINQNENDLTPYTESTYNVFVRSYSESLIRRDLQDGVYYFDCNIVLEEA